jgi:monovalent cation:H+ antiporter, CPA1 family
MSLPEWLLVSSGLLALAVVLGIGARRTGVQLTVVLVVVGFLAGSLGALVEVDPPLEGERFEEVVVFLFLPVLVFEAAIGLSVRAFFRNLVPILVLAVVALLVSAALVGAALNAVLGIPLAAALLFGALISATDPVAVVAVFRELGVPRRLLTLIEGESMLNDGVAIVLFGILLEAALGETVSLGAGVLEFVVVFFGGAGIGAALGLAVVLLLPWLDRNLTAALSVALAYGSFVLAGDVLGFSGVMATVAAGLAFAGFAPSRASAESRTAAAELWESLGYVANALLFLFIGLAIEPRLIGDHAGAIAVAILVVLLARAVAVVPIVSALERLARIPPVGRRNEAVLVWGGLRGGVALALALALPEGLEQRDQFVAMTGGVVLATLLLNATTIRGLIHRLGLDETSRAERFLAAVARLSGAGAARRALEDLALEDRTVLERLGEAERDARTELGRIELREDEQRDVISRRGLYVERQTYQRLSDLGMLPPPTTRKLLHEVDDLIEEVTTSGVAPHPSAREAPPLGRLWVRLVARLPEPAGEDPADLAYAEAMARRIAARRTAEALELFDAVPSIDAGAVRAAQAAFATLEERAEAALREFGGSGAAEGRGTHDRIAHALTRVAARDALDELVATALLPPAVAASGP